MYLYQARLSNAVAGAIVSADGQVIRCAPILGAFVGQHINNLRRWVRLRQGELQYLGKCWEG